MKKVFIVLSVLVAFVFIFSGCSSSDTETTTRSETIYNDELEAQITAALPDDSWYKEDVTVIVSSTDGNSWTITTSIYSSDGYVFVQIYEDVVDVIKNCGLNYTWENGATVQGDYEYLYTYTTSDCVTGYFLAVENGKVTANQKNATVEDLHEYMSTKH